MNFNKQKAKLGNFSILLFIILYSASCLLVSRPDINGIFGFNSFNYQLIKMVVVFSAILLVTIINKKSIAIIAFYCRYYTMLIGIIFFIDSSFTRLSGNLYYRLWWMCIIHIAYFAVYTAIFITQKVNFSKLITQITKGYAVLYIACFVSIFLRPLGNEATVNFKIGSGTLSFFSYIIKYPTDWEIILLTIGNIIFFVPIPFILKALIPKIKAYQQILIGVFIPIFIELYQLLLRCGDVDIDDLIMNFAGFLSGLLLLTIQVKIKNSNKKQHP